jgi:long-subunit fatty acid transport protein
VDIDEDTTRFGLGLNWLPNKNWMVGASLDVDRVSSGDRNREQDRTRFGVNARYSF